MTLILFQTGKIYCEKIKTGTRMEVFTKVANYSVCTYIHTYSYSIMITLMNVVAGVTNDTWHLYFTIRIYTSVDVFERTYFHVKLLYIRVSSPC